MPLYVADYLGDTQHLSTEQHGAYLLLLMALWRAGGRLPNDPVKIARIVRLSPSKWSRIADDVMAFFTADGDEITAPALAAWARQRIKDEGRQPIPAALRLFVFERDGAACRYCGETDAPFEIDHILPVSRGGSNDPDNLALACFPCNRAKGSKLIEEWQP